MQEDHDDEQYQCGGFIQGLVNLVDGGARELRRIKGNRIGQTRGKVFAEFGHGLGDRFGHLQGVGAGQLIDGNARAGLAVKGAELAVCLGAQLDTANIPDPDDAAAKSGRDLDDDVFELFDLFQPAGHVYRELEILAGRRRRHAHLAGGHLKVLLLDGADDVIRIKAEALEHFGVQPDAHAVLTYTEDDHIARPRQSGEHVPQVDPGVVAEKKTVVATIRRVEVDDLQDGGGHFFCDGSLLLHVERQLGHGGGDTILDQNLCHVQIGTDLKGDDQLVSAVAGARRLHVEHVFDSVHLLLDRKRDGVSHHASARPGVGGGYLNGGWCDIGVLGYRQSEHRHHPQDDNQDGNNIRQDWPLNEKP